jgi:hypothetical protein
MKKNIYVLPTDQPSRLRYNLSNVLVFTNESYREYGNAVNQNIYITSDEEIKEDDWGLSRLNEVILFGRSYPKTLYKKIILTTDQDLIEDGVQAIDDEFLEWFVKNPTCDYVEVEKQYVTPLGDIVDTCYDNERLNYKIIIPKAEPKQDTPGIGSETFQLFFDKKYASRDVLPVKIGIEEKAENFAQARVHALKDKKEWNPDCIYHEAFNGYIFGSTETAEKLYSEEEVKRIIDLHSEFIDSKIDYEGINNATTSIDTPIWDDDEWFAKFKKK